MLLLVIQVRVELSISAILRRGHTGRGSEMKKNEKLKDIRGRRKGHRNKSFQGNTDKNLVKDETTYAEFGMLRSHAHSMRNKSMSGHVLL